MPSTDLLTLATRTYRTALLVALAAIPVPLVADHWVKGSGGAALQAPWLHQALALTAVGLSGFIAFVTFRCYQATREPFLRMLTVAFTGFAVIYLPYCLLARYSVAGFDGFLIFGPIARMVAAGFCAAALLVWRRPPDRLTGRAALRLWLPSAVIIVACLGLAALLAAANEFKSARFPAEWTAIGLVATGAAAMVVQRIAAPPMWLYLAGMALFGQSSATYLLSQPWTYLWWMAHAIYAGGFFLISYAVVRAFHTTKSFRTVLTDEEMVARLAASAAETEAERRNVDRLRRLAEASPVGVLVVAGTGTILFYNGRTAEMLPDLVRGRRISEPLAGLIGHSERGSDVEVSFAGSGVEALASWAPTTFENEPAVILWLYDLSHQKQIERALRQSLAERDELEHGLRLAAEAAERANAAKSRFLAAASHDIRQPLVPIKLFAELLEGEVKEPDALGILHKMRASLQSLDDLISRLLDFSRIDAGAIQVTAETVSLEPMLARFGHEMGPVARAKGLDLRVLPCSLWVRTDRVLVQQVLRNLIENAIRYTDRGKVLVGCRRHGTHVRLLVGDTGIGIAADEQQAIFGEFYQVGNKHRNRRDGLGLGLATVDRLCRKLGHPISVASIPGRGSLFGIDIPLVARPARDREPDRPQAKDLGHVRVLLIEDDVDARDAVATIMERWGWTVVGAGGRKEAMAALDGHGVPDIIVTDLRLEPEFSGVDAIRMICDIARRDVPAVIITGDNAHDDLTAAMGGWPVRTKPFSARQLHAAMAEAMARGGRTAAE